MQKNILCLGISDTLQALKPIIADFGNIHLLETIQVTAIENIAVTLYNPFDWVIFTSKNGVQYAPKDAMEILVNNPKTSFACVGKSTAKVLEEVWKVSYPFIPSQSNMNTLMEELPTQAHQNVLHFCGNLYLQNPQIEMIEDKKQLRIVQIPVYETQPKPICNEDKNMLSQTVWDIVVVLSPSAIKSLITQVEGIKKTINLTKVISIGESTSRYLQEQNIHHFITAETSDLEGIKKAIQRI